VHEICFGSRTFVVFHTCYDTRVCRCIYDVYIYVYVAAGTQHMPSVRTFVGLSLTLLLAGTHDICRLVHGEDFRCVSPDPPIVKMVFSIHVIAPLIHPMLPLLRKRSCVSSTPRIDVRIATRQFNMLNATISVEACRHMYRDLICTDLKPNIQNECEYANLIMFAAAEGMPHCTTDSDCAAIHNHYELPGLWCDWALEIRQEVCLVPMNASFVDSCVADPHTATRIRTACMLTNTVCAFMVANIHLLAPLTGISMFVLSFIIIYITHPAAVNPHT